MSKERPRRPRQDHNNVSKRVFQALCQIVREGGLGLKNNIFKYLIDSAWIFVFQVWAIRCHHLRKDVPLMRIGCSHNPNEGSHALKGSASAEGGQAAMGKPHKTEQLNEASEGACAWMPGPGFTARPKGRLDLWGLDLFNSRTGRFSHVVNTN